MNLRHKKRNNHIDSMQKNYQPVIGLFNHMAVLNCQVQPQQHHFNINFQHPLLIINRLSQKIKKYAFQKLIQATFNIKIEQKTTFVPQALLNGKYEIIHEYKKLLERSRIGSYIKLNIRHQQKSYEKKKPLSLDLNRKNTIQQTQKINKNIKVFNENSVNERTSTQIHQYVNTNKIKNHLNSTYLNVDTPIKNDRSFLTSKTSHKVNQQNINITQKVSQIHNINHTHIYNIKKSKSKSNNKQRPIDGIKINYIQVKGSQQNPQKSIFIYKSSATKTNRNTSQFGTKTQIFSPNFNQFDKTLNHDLSFSVNNDKISSHTMNIRQHENDDNLSEKYQKSIKNSQMSQLTHDEMYTQDYFFTDRKILKKGRKAVYVQNFERKQNI